MFAIFASVFVSTVGFALLPNVGKSVNRTDIRICKSKANNNKKKGDKSDVYWFRKSEEKLGRGRPKSYSRNQVILDCLINEAFLIRKAAARIR